MPDHSIPTTPQDATIEIPLSRGLVAIIDPEDYDLVAHHKWHAKNSNTKTYAVRQEYLENGGKKAIRMHRLIMGASDDQMVDHINGDGLDNRKSNLRFCTPQQNSWNRSYRARKAVTPQGVYKRIDGTYFIRLTIGEFKTAEEARVTYEYWCSQIQGEFYRPPEDDAA